MSKNNTILEKMIDFAVQIIRLCSALPSTPVGHHLTNQLLRCGTAPVPNYAKAQESENPEDLFQQLGKVLKDLDELAIWLEIIKRSEILSLEFVELLVNIINENNELVKIVNSSIRAIDK